MMLAPGDDVVEIITRGDRGAGQKQEDLGKGIHDPPGFPVIVDLREMLQKNSQARPRHLPFENRVHDHPPNHRIQGITSRPSRQNHPRRAVNLAAEPWLRLRPRLKAGIRCDSYAY